MLFESLPELWADRLAGGEGEAQKASRCLPSWGLQGWLWLEEASSGWRSMLIWHLWEAQAQGLVLVSVWEALAGEGGCGMRGGAGNRSHSLFSFTKNSLNCLWKQRGNRFVRRMCAAVVAHFEKTSPCCCIAGGK